MEKSTIPSVSLSIFFLNWEDCETAFYYKNIRRQSVYKLENRGIAEILVDLLNTRLLSV